MAKFFALSDEYFQVKATLTEYRRFHSFSEWTICKRPPSQYKASFYHTERVDKSDGSFFQPDSCVQYKYNTPWGRAKSTHSRRWEGHGSVLSIRTTLHRLSHFFFFCCDPFQISLPLRSLRSCKTQSPIHKEWQRGDYKRRKKSLCLEVSTSRCVLRSSVIEIMGSNSWQIHKGFLYNGK